MTSTSHDGHGIHEVHPDEALRPFRRRREARDRDRRRVGGQDAAGFHDAVEPPEELLLDGLVLDDRLDDEIRVRERREVRGGRDAVEGSVARLRRDLALLDLPAEVLLDRLQALLHDLLGHVEEDHVPAGQRRDVRDSRPHLPGADDADLLDAHPDGLLSGPPRGPGPERISGRRESDARRPRGEGRQRNADPDERRRAPDERPHDGDERNRAEGEEPERGRRGVPEESASARRAGVHAAAESEEERGETANLRDEEKEEDRDSRGEREAGRQDGQAERAAERSREDGRGAEGAEERAPSRHPAGRGAHGARSGEEKKERGDEPREKERETEGEEKRPLRERRDGGRLELRGDGGFERGDGADAPTDLRMRRPTRRPEARRDQGIFFEGERAADREDVAVDAGAATHRGVGTEQDETASHAAAHDGIAASDEHEASGQFTF
jgi:hypothetical protein